MKNTRLKTGRIVALLLAGGILTSCSVEQEFSELSEREGDREGGVRG